MNGHRDAALAQERHERRPARDGVERYRFVAIAEQRLLHQIHFAHPTEEAGELFVE